MELTEKPFALNFSSARRQVWDILQILITALVLILCFQGRGSQSVFVAAWLFLPSIRFLVSSGYRQHLLQRLQLMRASIQNYSTGGEKVPPAGVFWLLVIPSLILYLANGVSITTFDNLPVNLTATSLVLDGTADVSVSNEAWKNGRCASAQLSYSLQCRPNGVYSNYPAGMLVFALPVFEISHWVGGDLRNGLTQWRLAKWTGAWLTALSVGMLFLVLLEITTLPAACWAAVLLACGSAMISTNGQGLWYQTGVIFWLSLVVLLEFQPLLRRSAWAPYVQGIAFGLMFACRLSSATFIAPFLLWVFMRDGFRATRMALVGILSYLPFGIFYWEIYHNPLGPQLRVGLSQGPWATHFLPALAGVLVSPARGLLVYQPWILLAVLVFFTPRLRRENVRPRTATLPQGWMLFCATAVFFHLILIAAWPNWWGGLSWGSRMMAETIPLLILCVGPAIAWVLEHKHGVQLMILVALLSFSVHLTGVFLHGGAWNGDPKSPTQPEIERLWDWSDPPFLYPFFRP